MDTVNSRHLLFLVGMHRSGTSALCAALNACGASFGSDLLEPMERVNERGFWESSAMVALNERLLHLAGVEWYSVTSAHLDLVWDGPQFESERRDALALLKSGFGEGPLEAVKDPRLCITLPFWLNLCAEIGLPASVCVMTRSATEVCRSLAQRDGFPPGYGMRLLRNYMLGIVNNVPSDAICASYDHLLADPVGQIHEIAEHLPLSVNPDGLVTAVHGELRHQTAPDTDEFLLAGAVDSIDFAAFDARIESLYPIEQTLSQMADSLVYRGRELTSIGKAHAQALETLDQRDAELALLDKRLQAVGDLHSQALVTIRERDQQLADFGHRLQEIGDLHSNALQVIEERDEQHKYFSVRLQEIGELHTKALEVIREREAQLVAVETRLARCETDQAALAQTAKDTEMRLQRIFGLPLLGSIFRMIWKNETR